MYRKIRIAVVSLVIMAACLISSTATLSYFTDTEGTTNDFTVGNASTTLAIYDDITGDKQTFDASTYSPLTDNSIQFYLQATNTGNIPIYQRFRVTVPIILADVVTLNLSNMNNCAVKTAPEHTCSNDEYTVTYNPSVEINNTPAYAEYYIISNRILDVNETTSEWPTESIQINGISEVDITEFTCSDQDENNCKVWIDAYSDAIQTTGFENAIKAFEDFAETYNN